MESPSIVPGVSLVINLASSTGEQTAPGARFLTSLLRKLEMPCTWVVDQPSQAKPLADKQLAPASLELALAVNARTPQRLRSELANQQAAVVAAVGQEVSVVAGDAQQLRSRAALLADLGITAVISESRESGSSKPPRLWPCGLWQFDSAVTIPQPRRPWSWLPRSRPSVKQLLDIENSGNQKVITFQLGQLTSRDLQGCERLLRELAEAVHQQQLRLATVSELTAELASRHEVKPQRSILRRAA